MDPDEFIRVPEYYTDSVNFQTNLYGFMLEFGIVKGAEQAPAPVVRMRMSPQHAKIMSLLLRKNVREYEHRIGTIILPDDLFQQLDIKDE